MRSPGRVLWLFFLILVGGVAVSGSFTSEVTALAITPTPTPTPPFTPRHYDPPAPPDLLLPAEAKSVESKGYPHIVKLWGGYDPEVGITFYTQYDMLISEGFTEEQLLYFRTVNPQMILLYSGIGTYDLDDGPLGSRWVNASPGTREYECFYRGTDGEVLRVAFWGHGMFNMGDEWCRGQIVDYLASQFNPEVYQGVFFDRITQVITPVIIDGIDLDHDGQVDDRDKVNDLYWHGTESFLDAVRERLGSDLIIVANDAPLPYTTRLNGREYESFIRRILDGDLDWLKFRYNYEQWMLASRSPPYTMVMANPPSWMIEKYGIHPYSKMKKAVVQEASSYYRRMRFGLTTALLEGGLYSFEFGDTWHGNAWWYDEFDGAGLGKGYLGQPLGEAYYATGPLTSTNLLHSSDPDTWTLQVAAGEATLHSAVVTAPYTTALTTTLAARIIITAGGDLDDIRLEQGGITLTAGYSYTLSFWARATSQLWKLRATLHAPGDLSALYGLDSEVELGTAWQQYWMPFTATANVADAVLSFSIGGHSGEVWLDEAGLREGTLPAVFRRDFTMGTVLCNATHKRQFVTLGGTFRKLKGTQAPLARIIVDDSDADTETFFKIGGWAGHDAGYDEWGSTYHHALTTADPTTFHSRAVWRPEITYSGPYTIYAWLAPHEQCTATITYTISHFGGITKVAVNPVVTAPTWTSLGVYTLSVGAGHCVTLSNYTTSTWVVADALKFESLARYNDGAQVTSVLLEPRDGIILLKEPPFKVYCPVVARLAGQ